MMMNRIVQHGNASVNRFIKIPIDDFPETGLSRFSSSLRLRHNGTSSKVEWRHPNSAELSHLVTPILYGEDECLMDSQKDSFRYSFVGISATIRSMPPK